MADVDIVFNAGVAKIRGIDAKELESYLTYEQMSLDKQLLLSDKTKFPFTPMDSEGGYFYSSTSAYHVVPTGLLIAVLAGLKRGKHTVNISKKIAPVTVERKPFIQVRDEQAQAIELLVTRKRGIIKAPTAWGKSRAIAETTRQFSRETSLLILVPTTLLLYQMKEDIVAYTGCAASSIGLVGDGGVDVSQNITVALPNTLYSRISKGDPELRDFLLGVGVLILDECHTMLSPTVLYLNDFLLSTEYRFGVSATPTVNDMATGFIGPLLKEFSIQSSIARGDIMEPTVLFHSLETKVAISPELATYKFKDFSSPREMKIYNTLYDTLVCKNGPRNKLGAEIAKADFDKGHTVLVLVKKVGTSGGSISHAEIMQEALLEVGVTAGIMHGKTKHKEEIKQQLEAGTLRCLIASVGILSEGVSINSISSLVLMSAGSSSKDFIQRVGRALRKGSMEPMIHDFYDNQSLFESQSRKRGRCAEDEYGVKRVRVISSYP